MAIGEEVNIATHHKHQGSANEGMNLGVGMTLFPYFSKKGFKVF